MYPFQGFLMRSGPETSEHKKLRTFCTFIEVMGPR